jgi:hypothetical protein
VTWFDSLRQTAAQDWFFAFVPDTSTDAGPPLEPERCYVSAYLSSLHLAHSRVGTRRLFASVSSVFTVASRSLGPAEFMAVTTPSVLRDADADNLDRVVTLDKPLLGPVPYRGGDIGAEIGLFAVPAADLLQPYLNLIEEVTTFVGVRHLTPSSDLLRTAKNGLDLLFGAGDDPTLEVGFSGTLNRPAAGHYCVVRAPRDHPGLAGLRVAPDNRLLNGDGAAVTEPYLVFQLRASATRADWASVPDIRARYDELSTAARIGDVGEAQRVLESFRRAAVFSPDLLAADGVRLWNLVRAELALAFPATPTAAADGRPGLPELDTLPLYDGRQVNRPD